MNKILKSFLILVLACIPLIYMSLLWKTIPQTIPIHFGIDGKANGYGSKATLLYTNIFLALLSFGCFLLVQNLDKIDPKRAGKPLSATFNKLGIGLVFFLTAINLFIVMKSAQNISIIDRFQAPLIGLLFAFIGNYMYNIKPNYFVGLRIPWTLNSDYNWKKTHQFGSRIWFIGGILVTIASLLLPLTYANRMMPVCIGIMVLIPIAYSFMLFKKEQANPDIAKQDKD